MALARRAFITGGAHTTYLGKGHPDFIWKRHPDFGSRENPTLEETLQSAVDDCLADTGVDPAQIDRLYIGNFVGELFVNQGHLGAALAGTHPAFAGKPSARLEGRSGGLALLAGLDAIAAGADLVLLVEIKPPPVREPAATTSPVRHITAGSVSRMTSLFRCSPADRAYGESTADRRRPAHFAVKAYANANCNARAHAREDRHHGACSDARRPESPVPGQPELRLHEGHRLLSGVGRCQYLLLASEAGSRSGAHSPIRSKCRVSMRSTACTPTASPS